ncbi:GNAT family N-acetyltransferase [Streptomyces albofaciens JCM 4342]|uniref:GNAT family N-acetyltransferase n=1 Tax=Streptomyces albofaciens TaxID=66866 RepID=UPI00123A8EA8|nr:GNAT family N-acetyltransferase [Streptomyces albofaciens]KAA6224297.1 GNAT family N-acetyltransferase [Streptomyces albofaciens JCM 4342]
MTDTATGRPTETWRLSAEPDDSPAATALFREYYTEVAARYHVVHGFPPITPEEIDEGVAEYPVGRLVPPHGELLIVRQDGAAVGCGGLLLLDGGRTAELKRVFVRGPWRGRGAAGVLMRGLERRAAELGAARIRLDTRSDLVEAVAMYRAYGYGEIPAYKEDRYSDLFFEKAVLQGRR